MKCPSCGYKDGFFKGEGHVYGAKGEFYKAKDLSMTRGNYLNREAYPLFACPSCGISFMLVR